MNKLIAILTLVFSCTLIACDEQTMCPQPEMDAGVDPDAAPDSGSVEVIPTYVHGPERILRRDWEDYCTSVGGTPLEISDANEWQRAYVAGILARNAYLESHPHDGSAANVTIWLDGDIDIIGDGLEDDWALTFSWQSGHFLVFGVLDTPNATYTAIPICEVLPPTQ